MFTKGRRRRRSARVLRLALWGLAAGYVLEALVLRRRREQLTALPEPPEELAHTDDGAVKVEVLSVAGAQPDKATLAAASADMEASGAEVVDLVPGDISATRALTVLRRLDLERLDRDPIYAPGGAHEAVALDPAVAQRMGVPEGGESLARGRLMRRTITAQRYAPTKRAVRVAPTLRATPASPQDRWHELEEGTAFLQPYFSLAPTLLGLEAARLAAITAGLFAAPLAGAAALAAWSAQPLLVFAGGATSGHRGLTPPDLGTSSLLRLPRGWVDHLRTVATAYDETRAARARQASESVPDSPPNEELFEETRSTCPWCGSTALVGMFDVADVFQHKPVTTHLDSCSDCGHVFQNPQLTTAALDYVYRDFYDGANQEIAEWQLGALTEAHEARVRTVKQFVQPKSWLDVGSSHSHFCLTARQELPDTVFDGLDMGETVEVAQRRGWIDNAHRGFFLDLADSLPRYDVVSMNHYLEHTKDPRAELEGAARAVEPGAYLEIEVPDPESRWGRVLGPWWYQWGQPQHLNFVTCDNMVAELEKLGFDVVSVERGPAGFGNDVSVSVIMRMLAVTVIPQAPWLPPPTLADRLKRIGVFTAGMPAMILAGVVDGFKDDWLRRHPDQVGNGYRVMARRREAP